VSTTTRPRPVPAEPAGPTVDPRIRQRRADVAKAAGRRRLRWVLLGALVVALGADGWMALHSSLLAAKVVTITGAVHETRPEILAAAGLSDQPPMVSVDPGATAAALERLAWVGHATVVRHWPDSVSIAVTERVPAAVAAVRAGRWLEVDATGRVLAVVPAPPPGLVVLHVAAPVATGGVLVRSASPILAVADSLPPAFRAQVAGISSTPAGVELALTTPVTVVLGSPDQLTAKYEDVAALLAGAPLHAGDIIDVAVPESPTVTSA